MNKLFHYFLCPSSRFTRVILIEKKIDFDLFIENFSDPTEDYLFKNPAGFFPVLNTSFNENIVGSIVIVEYLQNLMLLLYLLPHIASQTNYLHHSIM